MAEKDLQVAPYKEELSLQQITDDLGPYLSLMKPNGKLDKTSVIRVGFESRYSEELAHYRQTLLPQPDKEDDPEAYRQWLASQEYWTNLARSDMRAAMIVKRLATSVDEKVNTNQPPHERQNRHGEEIDEYGTSVWRREILNYERDEQAGIDTDIEEMIKASAIEAGVVVPLNQFEVEAITRHLEHTAITETNLLAYDEISIGPWEEGDEAYTVDGKLVIIEFDSRKQALYQQRVDEATSKTEQLNNVAERYRRALGRVACQSVLRERSK